MKRYTYILVVALLFVALAAPPLFSAQKKSPKLQSPATSTATKQEEPSKTGKSKAIDSRSNGAETTIKRNQPTTERSIETTRPETAVPTQPSTQRAGTAAGIQMDWVSINHGGAIEVASGDLKMGLSIAQTVAGEVSAGDLKMGLGFWYGAAGGAAGCSCPHQADLDTDGFPTTLDLGILIDIAFGGVADVPNPGCPTSRGDFDNDSFVTTLDVGWMIDYLYAGGPEPCDPCNPAQASCAAK